jgi:hypothetical protein
MCWRVGFLCDARWQAVLVGGEIKRSGIALRRTPSSVGERRLVNHGAGDEVLIRLALESHGAWWLRSGWAVVTRWQRRESVGWLERRQEQKQMVKGIMKESKQASRAGAGEVDQVIKRQQRQRRMRFAQRTGDDIVSISGAWARVLAPHSDLRAETRSKQVNCRLLAPALVVRDVMPDSPVRLHRRVQRAAAAPGLSACG